MGFAADSGGKTIDRKVILVVEDEVLIRFALADGLRDAGYFVTEAANGDDATTVLRSGQHFDLIITDVNMPGDTDGIALAIFAKHWSATLPVIVTTGRLAREETYPADAFIQKPYSDDALLQIVMELIGSPCRKNNRSQSAS